MDQKDRFDDRFDLRKGIIQILLALSFHRPENRQVLEPIEVSKLRPCVGIDSASLDVDHDQIRKLTKLREKIQIDRGVPNDRHENPLAPLATEPSNQGYRSLSFSGGFSGGLLAITRRFEVDEILKPTRNHPMDFSPIGHLLTGRFDPELHFLGGSIGKNRRDHPHKRQEHQGQRKLMKPRKNNVVISRQRRAKKCERRSSSGEKNHIAAKATFSTK